MNADVYLWYNVAQLVLEWDIIMAEIVDKIKTLILCSIDFFSKSCHLRDNVKKVMHSRDATCDNVIRRMCFVCWIIKARDTHSEYVIFTLFLNRNSGYEKAPKSYVYTYITRLVITVTDCVYCAVRTALLFIFQVNFLLSKTRTISCSFVSFL
jgi:hypothetical protein